MPYVPKNQYDLLLRDQELLLKIETILLSSMSNPPSDGVTNYVDLAEMLVERAEIADQLKFEISSLELQLEHQKGFTMDTEDKLKKAINRETLEIEVNKELSDKLKDQEVLEEMIKCLKGEVHILRQRFKLVEEAKQQEEANVRRLKTALQAILGCMK